MKCFSIITIVIMLFFSIQVTAYSEDDIYEQSIDDIIESTDNETVKLLESLGLESFSAEELADITVSDILNLLLGIFKGKLKIPVKILTSLTGIIIIYSSISCFLSNHNLNVIFDSIAVVVCSLMIFSELMNCISDSVTALKSLCTLMKTLIPAIAVIATLSGSPALAVSFNAVTVYAAEIIGALCADFLTPLLMIFSVISVCITFNPVLKSDILLSGFKKIVNVVLGLSASVFTGISGIKNLLSSGTDKISVKGIQFVLGSSVPVVGGALSDGLSSVIAAISLMRSTIGIAGIIIITVTVLPAVCQLVLWQIAFSVILYVSDIFSAQRINCVVQSLRFTISMMLSVILFCAYLFIVSIGMVILLGSR